MPAHSTESPAKKQSKWSADEDSLIIDLRGGGMKWEDISKRLPGRSAISCRLHYQNYLERRSEWDEERKNKLARLYERFKPEMWQKVAEEMAMPWRAAEAMHWQLGEQDMARRAGVTPFTLSNSATAAGAADNSLPPASHRGSPRHHHHHHHSHSYSHGSVPRDMVSPQRASAPYEYTRGGLAPHSGIRPLASRRESVPPLHLSTGMPELHPQHYQPPSAHPEPQYYQSPSAPASLAPIQAGPPQRGMGMLPGVAELTTGISPFSTPAYSSGVPSAAMSPAQTSMAASTTSPSPYPQAMPYPPAAGTKRRRSAEPVSPDAGRRRHHHDPRSEPVPRYAP